MNRRPFDHLALVLIASLSLPGCAMDAPADAPAALEGTLGGLDGGAPAPAASDDLEIDAITQASQCIAPPESIIVNMGPAGWQYSAQTWYRADPKPWPNNGCINTGVVTPFQAPPGALSIISNNIYSGGCVQGNTAGILCGPVWVACPATITIDEPRFTHALPNGGSVVVPWSYLATLWSSSAGWFSTRLTTTAVAAPGGQRVQCNYVYANQALTLWI